MQLSVPPSLGGQNSFQSHPVLGTMGPPLGQFTAGAYGSIGAMGGINPVTVQRGSNMGSSKPSELIIGGPAPAPSVLSPTEPLRPVNDHGNLIFFFIYTSSRFRCLILQA